MGLFVFTLGAVIGFIGLSSLLAGIAFGNPGVTTHTTTRTSGNGRRSDIVTTANSRAGGIALGLLLLAIGGLIIFFDSYTTVEARGVAVQTSFGKVRGEPLKAGWHWVAPWNNVEKFDASVQTLKFYQAEPKDDGDCITVRLGNSTPACVDVTVQWNINHQGDVNGLYLQYKSFDNIHDNLVKRQLGSALNEVFGTYDPLATLGKNDTLTVNTKDLQDKVLAALQKDLGSAIQIDSVTIPIVHFDADTENRLKAYQQAKADTRIAEQQNQTAQQQAASAATLAGQPGIEKPGVQYQNCLNLIKDLAQRDQLKSLPPTFTCNPYGTPAIIQTKP